MLLAELAVHYMYGVERYQKLVSRYGTQVHPARIVMQQAESEITHQMP